MLGKLSSLKKGWLLFWIEATFLIGVAVVLLVLLNYFNIISLSRYVPILDFLPRQYVEIFDIEDETAPISVSSERKDYQVVINSPEYLEAFFTKFSVREQKEKEFEVGPLEKTIITLSDEKDLQHRYGYFDGTKTTEFSYQFNVMNNNTLVLFLYLPDKELEGAEASTLFSKAVMYAVTKLPDDTEILPLPSDKPGMVTLFSVHPTDKNAKPYPMPSVENRNAIPVPSSGVNR